MTARPAPSLPVVPRLRVVRGKRADRPQALGWVLVAILGVALFMGLVFANTALDRTAFELDAIHSDIAAEQARFDELRLEVARLRSPERIQPMAEALGMVYPDPADRRTVTAPGVVVVDRDADRWTDIKTFLSASP